MFKKVNKRAQAAIEVAVFGAIIVFILGTIVRTALGNAYAQNQNFNAMRMAMLASWTNTEAHQGKGALANTTRNNASILVVEDRLTPDFNKYGALDRNPYISQGAGTFTFNLLYPWQPGVDDPKNLVPIMDVWINGQHFPLTTAAYQQNITVSQPSCTAGGPYQTYPLSMDQCKANQCLRNQREWAGGVITASQFDNIVPVSVANFNDPTLTAYGQAIFHALVLAGAVLSAGVSTGKVPLGVVSITPPFTIIDPTTSLPLQLTQDEINAIESILQSNRSQYKLFYTRVVNGTPQFTLSPPQMCSGVNNGLCSSLTMLAVNPAGAFTNSNGDMQFDLLRNADYINPGDPNAVETTLPVGGPMRGYIAWQWAASPAISAESIGLDISSNQYPTYDIDGRLKEVTIYGITQDAIGEPVVTYEDFQGGDIDATWDNNTCGPKPGLQTDMQVYTFTQSGTYLEIKEGNLFDPETDQFVRSVSKRDTIDLIQRTIQLSNDTGDFCNGSTPQFPVNASPDPNPVTVCVTPGTSDNCFTAANIAQTCFDENDNRMFVRSRLQDQRGHYWMTDTSGQLWVH